MLNHVRQLIASGDVDIINLEIFRTWHLDIDVSPQEGWAPVLILPTFDVLSNFWNLLSSLTSRSIDKMDHLLAALVNFRKGSVEYEKDAVTVEGVRVCPEFRHDRLNSPSSWPGYKEFIAAIPPERDQAAHSNWSDQYESPGLLIDNIASFEDHYPKVLFYAAFHYPATSAGGAKVSQSCQDIYIHFRLITSLTINTSVTFDYRWRRSTVGNSSSPGNHCVRWL